MLYAPSADIRRFLPCMEHFFGALAFPQPVAQRKKFFCFATGQVFCSQKEVLTLRGLPDDGGPRGLKRECGVNPQLPPQL